MDTELREERKERIAALVKSAPMRVKEVAVLMGVPKAQRTEFSNMVDELIAAKKIFLDGDGRLTSRPSQLGDVVQGEFHGNARGFGFVSVEDAETDIFIPPAKTGGAINKDTVLCKLLSGAVGNARCEGEVIRVLKRGYAEIVGVFFVHRENSFVRPDDRKINDIFIPKANRLKAVEGNKVVISLEPSGEGRVMEILGHVNDPGVDVLSIVRQAGIPAEFPEEVIDALNAVPEEVSPRELAGREDFRNELVITIDGEDTKDVDDAVSVTEIPGGYRLAVHIADVTHYVTEDSPLDKEAYKRGTSCYLADRVIPMLPPQLSNGICSLNEGVDRLCLSCVMDIDEKAVVTAHRIVTGVVTVKHKMTYTTVNDLLTNENSIYRKEYEGILPMLEKMRRLAEILRDKRIKRGAIEFDFPESKIIVDSTGWPVDIRPGERNVATKIIEEFMLACNETVAEEYFWRELPFVYRTHDEPDADKMQRLSEYLAGFGYTLKGRGSNPRSIQALLSKIESTPAEAAISRMVLRSFKQARYTEENTGHFGLAAKFYSHFTSPIRRYPDLQIHRIIKENLQGKLNGKRQDHYHAILPEACRICSTTERRAELAEREAAALKKAEFMSDKVGMEFDGVVTGVTSFGAFVALESTVEGMIPLDAPQNKHAAGNLTVGQAVRVYVAGVSIAERKIDFFLL